MCVPSSPKPPPPPPPAPPPASEVNAAEIRRRELAPKAPQAATEQSPTMATQKRRRGKAALRIPLQQSYIGGGTGVNIP